MLDFPTQNSDRLANAKTAAELGGVKPPLAELPWRALNAVAEAIAAGQREHDYKPHNWRSSNLSAMGLASKALRHLAAWLMGIDRDANGAHHLAAAAFNVLALLELELTNQLRDDRAHKAAP
jgi:hypothetical protein